MARTTGSHADITGPAIREAALRLFARHGYAAVSMRQIAAEVGVRAGALYLYTPDKQTLLFDMLKSHLEELLGELDDAVPQDAPAPARLEAWVRFHVRFHASRRDKIFLSNMELRNLDAENFAVIRALRRRYEMSVGDILADGVESGAFRVEDLRVTTLAVVGMLTGLSMWFRGDGRLNEVELADIYWRLVSRMVSA